MIKKIFVTIKVFIFLMLFFNSHTWGNENLTVNLDICQFRFNNDSSLVEVYYGFTAQSGDSSISGPYVLQLQISQGDQRIYDHLWKVNKPETEQTGAEQGQSVVDVLKYLLTPGKYDFNLIVKNMSNPELIDSAQVANYQIRTFDESNTQISDIELAQFIAPANQNQNQVFNKNNFNVLPNPFNLYDQNNANVYYYLELYDLNREIQTEYYYLKRVVFDSYGLPIVAIPAYNKMKRLRGKDDVEVGMFDISKLPSGKYYLTFAALDTNNNELATANTSFFVHNPEVLKISRNNLSIENQAASSEIALLSDDMLNVILGATQYFLDENERKVVQNLENDQAKKIFLYRFWKENDSNVATPVLESYRMLLNRVRYANNNFSQIRTEGWKSDRGRILILYGEPSEIQYYSNLSDLKEFQAWSYDNIENGVVFIFGVLGSFGDLQLIHSTKTGELYNNHWLDLLKVSEGRAGLDDLAPGVSEMDAVKRIFRKYDLELPRYLR